MTRGVPARLTRGPDPYLFGLETKANDVAL